MHTTTAAATAAAAASAEQLHSVLAVMLLQRCVVGRLTVSCSSPVEIEQILQAGQRPHRHQKQSSSHNKQITQSLMHRLYSQMCPITEEGAWSVGRNR